MLRHGDAGGRQRRLIVIEPADRDALLQIVGAAGLLLTLKTGYPMRPLPGTAAGRPRPSFGRRILPRYPR